MPQVVLFVTVIVLIVVYRCIVVLQENERAVVLRLGRFLNVLGPGIIFVLPAIDKVYRVKLPTHVSDWQSLSPEQLKSRVKDLVLNDRDPRRFAND